MKRILVADDDPQTRQILKIFLEKAGYHVDEAENGAQALSLLDHVQPSLVFLDIVMPDMDGLEALHWIRQRYPELVVIIMTGMTQEEIWKKAMLSGATDFMAKPFSLEQLRTNLSVHLSLNDGENH